MLNVIVYIFKLCVFLMVFMILIVDVFSRIIRKFLSAAFVASASLDR